MQNFDLYEQIYLEFAAMNNALNCRVVELEQQLVGLQKILPILITTFPYMTPDEQIRFIQLLLDITKK